MVELNYITMAPQLYDMLTAEEAVLPSITCSDRLQFCYTVWVVYYMQPCNIQFQPGVLSVAK